MIVSVPHGPSAQVSLRVFIFTAVDITHISICPLLERIILLRVLKNNNKSLLTHSDVSFAREHLM